ncbi:STAS domain-containing protein [Streptomyces sp. A7024]|uniref:STAS domain-containing protein n=1 Tax=Streptomyces coryli TaxID=1128680 RepID=A0A6G4U8B0_9ACTN|nr:STAS domain-containing protein [Streptomyces coryli]NGN68353.1 STAS domain-containing protein [Streptomyces coryli]
MDPVGTAPSFRATPIEKPPGLRIEGIVDATTHRRLSEALQGLVDGDPEPGGVGLDVSGVEFIDLAGLRMILQLARDRAEYGGLVLIGLRPHLVRVLQLTGWDEWPGLHLEGTARNGH